MRWAKPKIGNVKDGINCVLLWVPRAGDILESILPRHERAEKGLVPVTYFNIDLGEVVIGTIRKREEDGIVAAVHAYGRTAADLPRVRYCGKK